MPISIVPAPIVPGIYAMAMLFACKVLTCINWTIVPTLLAFAVLKVILPLTFVASSVCVYVNTETICFIIHPSAFVYITVDMNEFSLAISSVILPVALVTSAVWPDLASKTISETAYPFTRVGCSRFEFEFWSRFTDTIRVISYVAQCFSLFFGCKVSIVRSFGTFYEFDLLAGSVSSIKSLNFVYEFYIWLEMLEGRLLQQMLGARFSLLHFSKVDLPYAGSCFVLGQARLRSFWIRLTYRCSRNYCRLHPF